MALTFVLLTYRVRYIVYIPGEVRRSNGLEYDVNDRTGLVDNGIYVNRSNCLLAEIRYLVYPGT